MTEEQKINQDDQQENQNEQVMPEATEPETSGELAQEPTTAEVENQPEAETSEPNTVSEEKTEEAETPTPLAEQPTPEPEPVPEPIEKVRAEEESPISTAHDDFDWDMNYKDGQTSTNIDRELDRLYEESLVDIIENEVIPGKIVALTETDVVLNVGFKSDGLVPRSEFRDLDEIKIGETVEVYVVKKEDEKGQLLLSRKNAKLMKAWDSIASAYENGTILNGRIVSKTKGGLIVDMLGLETFLPGSQIDVRPITDYDAYVGKVMEFKVVKINELIKNAVVSHKALIESDLEQQRDEIMSRLDKGQVLEGVVKNITDFGAFIDLGGVDGLLYITDISWGRINHPSEVLEINQKINVVVLEFDDERKRISLGLKQLLPHPWELLDESIQVGSVIKGKVVNVEDYGAFLEIQTGVEGLIHISEVSWSLQPVHSKDYFTVDKEYEAKVIAIDREDRKMSLSIKQMSQDPWINIEEKYAPHTRHTGLVKNITPYGVFVELEEGIGGMVHISDLSWIKRYNHPSEFVKVGENLECIVLDIDLENRKLSLGHRQIEEDPWDTFENVFPVGSVHEGNILKKDDKGAIVLLPYGLEGFAPGKHLKKEDGSTVLADEKLEFKVIEFDRNDKRILLSHSRLWEEKKETKAKETAEKEEKKTQSTLKQVNQKLEKTTLGDLGVLSDLKEKMEASEKKKSGKKAEKEVEAPQTPSAPIAEDNAPDSAEDKSEEA